MFSNLPFQRRKEASSIVAHFITGVLEEKMMVAGINTLCQFNDWKPDGAEGELTSLPESLCADAKPKG